MVPIASLTRPTSTHKLGFGSSVDGFGGGYRLTRVLELCDIVLNHCLNCWIETKGIGKRCEVLHVGTSLFHQLLPICGGYLCVSQSEQDVSELYLMRVTSSLMHYLCEDKGFVKLKVGSSSLIRGLSSCL